MPNAWPYDDRDHVLAADIEALAEAGHLTVADVFTPLGLDARRTRLLRSVADRGGRMVTSVDLDTV